MVNVCLQSLYDKHLGVEFQSEIRTLAQVEHLNLVRFYGYLEYQDERIVVVEYVPNGTLREHLDCEFFPFGLFFFLCLILNTFNGEIFLLKFVKLKCRRSWQHS